ncbi:MAG TPA: hypothetical protein VKQ10_02835 [Spirochaetota bacterium]|nr:hypothetical protein [Spirochaetota bacterium]
MFIHVGERKVISDKKIVGIFNAETISMSEENVRYMEHLEDGVKTVVIDTMDTIITSGVSSFTVIKRININKDCVWSRADE